MKGEGNGKAAKKIHLMMKRTQNVLNSAAHILKLEQKGHKKASIFYQCIKIIEQWIF